MLCHINNTQQTRYPLKDENSVNITDSRIKSNFFVNLFCPRTTPEELINLNDDREKEFELEVTSKINDLSMDNMSLPFSNLELKFAISKLKSKSTSEDRISNTMLTSLNTTNTKFLLNLFNLLFDTGYVPPSWKTALAVPVLKTGKPLDDIKSYRPISLTSCIGKCMEKLINNRLKWYLEQYGHIPTCQAGFRAGCSTIDQLVKLELAIKKGFENSENTYAVFLDIANAYPSTWLTGLLYKLSKTNIKGKVLKWLNNFLRGRSMSVITEGAISDSRPLPKGVPQGSVLSPVLFNIMLANFPEPPPPSKPCDTSLFADDTKISTQAKSTAIAVKRLQPFLTTIQRWATKWKLTFSVEKSAVVVFTHMTHKEPDPTLYMYDKLIPVEDKAKFLGIILDNKLNWRPQVEALCAQISKRCNLLKILANPKSGMRNDTLLVIYKALIRSKLDYGSILLNTASKTLTNKIEVAQNNALRIVLGAMKSTPTKLLYLDSGITPVHHRRTALSCKYLIRLSQRPHNPAYESAKETYQNNNGWKSRSTPCITPLIPKLTQCSINLRWNCWPLTSRCLNTPPWKLPEIHTYIFPLNKKETLNCPDQVKSLFLEYLNSLPADSIIAYTNGSMHESTHSTACGIYIPKLDKQLSWKLSDHSSIFTAELNGIKKTLETLYNLEPEKRRDGKGYRGESITFFNENLDPQRSLRLGTELCESIPRILFPATFTLRLCQTRS